MMSASSKKSSPSAVTTRSSKVDSPTPGKKMKMLSPNRDADNAKEETSSAVEGEEEETLFDKDDGADAAMAGYRSPERAVGNSNRNERHVSNAKSATARSRGLFLLGNI